MVNKVTLIGNLGKDPEVKTITSGRKVASFTLATTDSYKDKNGEKQTKTEWHNIVFWGPIVDVIEKYLKKGSQVYIEGKIQSRSYDDKDNVKRYVTEILGDQLTMLGGTNKGSNGAASTPASQEATSSVKSSPVTAGEDNDDLPF